MGTVRIEMEVTLGAPPAAVAPFLMDHEKLPRWIPEIVSSKADDGGGPRVGAKYTQVWNFGGREQTLKGEVTECDPPAKYAYRATAGKNVFEGRFELTEEPDGKTRLKYAEESRIAGPWGLLAWAMKGAIRKWMETSFERLRALVEAVPPAAAAAAVP